jgi:hypothetical protein
MGRENVSEAKSFLWPKYSACKNKQLEKTRMMMMMMMRSLAAVSLNQSWMKRDRKETLLSSGLNR